MVKRGRGEGHGPIYEWEPRELTYEQQAIEVASGRRRAEEFDEGLASSRSSKAEEIAATLAVLERQEALDRMRRGDGPCTAAEAAR
eukprot:9732835-Heterocapsa_arctica.AAC.1